MFYFVTKICLEAILDVLLSWNTLVISEKIHTVY